MIPPGFGQTVTIKRYAAGAYVNGIYQPGAESQFSIEASIQPVLGEELVNMPQNQRERAVVKLYTETELREIDEASGLPADTFEYEGKAYEVQTVERFTMGLANHYKITASAMND